MTLVSKSAISYKNPKIACFHFSFRVCIIMNDNEWQLISSHILKFWRVNAQWDNTYYSEKIDNLGKPSSIGSVLRWQNPQGEGRSKEIFSTITKYREEKTASFTLKFQVFEDSKFSTKIDKTILEFLLINYFPS